MTTGTDRHRLFLALLPDAATRRALVRLRSRVIAFGSSEPSATVRWTPPHNWHITLIFLGSRSDAQTERLTALADEQLQEFAGLSATAGRLQSFPDAATAGCVWALSLEELSLDDRNAQATPAMATIGTWRQRLLAIPEIAEGSDNRAFLPHLTMARSRHARQWPERDVTMRCDFDRLVLMESVADPAGGVRYQSLSVAGTSL